MNKAIFFDRDGVINEMVFDTESGSVFTPLNSDQIILTPGIGQLMRAAKKLGYLNVIISNQTNIGLGRVSQATHESIRKTIVEKLEKENVVIDGEYYCFHHPFAKIAEYRKVCNCRKPNISLFMRAAKELDIDLKQSWMIGDGVADIIAGHNAGCKTILVANIYEAGYLKMIEDKLGNIKPDFLVKKLKDIIPIISANI